MVSYSLTFAAKLHISFLNYFLSWLSKVRGSYSEGRERVKQFLLENTSFRTFLMLFLLIMLFEVPFCY